MWYRPRPWFVWQSRFWLRCKGNVLWVQWRGPLRLSKSLRSRKLTRFSCNQCIWLFLPHWPNKDKRWLRLVHVYSWDDRWCTRMLCCDNNTSINHSTNQSKHGCWLQFRPGIQNNIIGFKWGNANSDCGRNNFTSNLLLTSFTSRASCKQHSLCRRIHRCSS